MSGDTTGRARWIGRLLAGSGIGCVGAALIATLLWWKLPQWAPQFVIDHSPWLDPVMRAGRRDGDVATGQARRFEHRLGERFVPSVAAYLTSRSPHERLVAGFALLDDSEDPRAFAALVAAIATSDAARDMLRIISQSSPGAEPPAYPAERIERARAIVGGLSTRAAGSAAGSR